MAIEISLVSNGKVVEKGNVKKISKSLSAMLIGKSKSITASEQIKRK